MVKQSAFRSGILPFSVATAAAQNRADGAFRQLDGCGYWLTGVVRILGLLDHRAWRTHRGSCGIGATGP